LGFGTKNKKNRQPNLWEEISNNKGESDRMEMEDEKEGANFLNLECHSHHGVACFLRIAKKFFLFFIFFYSFLNQFNFFLIFYFRNSLLN
jgi:hypothetical protein